jgi:mRNA interferase HigB
MQVIALRTLRSFWKRYPQAERPLRTWHKIVSKADWTSPLDVKAVFGTGVDFVADNRAIFDIGGNKYRLVVHMAYPFKKVLVKFVGTHKEYDNIDPESV